ncbi:hypothetical protein [Niallia taxi]|uniref:hypothetical protein n=1 Tax=Niallia taxi TaxID=2499688 RepID=UPI002E1AAA7B|nr:hypothetical protein [Niallia taxi]
MRKKYVSETEEVIKGWLGGIFILLPLALFLIYCFPKFFLVVIFMVIVFLIVRLLEGKKNKEKHEEMVIQKNDLSNEIIQYVLMDNTEAVKNELEKRGYGGNFKANTGETALELAILNRNKFIIAYLIKYGALPQPRDLKAAMESKEPEIIEMIKTGHHLKIIKRYELLSKK